MSENQEASTSSTLTSGQHSYATTFKNGLYLLKKKNTGEKKNSHIHKNLNKRKLEADDDESPQFTWPSKKHLLAVRKSRWGSEETEGTWDIPCEGWQ